MAGKLRLPQKAGATPKTVTVLIEIIGLINNPYMAIQKAFWMETRVAVGTVDKEHCTAIRAYNNLALMGLANIG